MRPIPSIDPVYIIGGGLALVLLIINAPSQLAGMNQQRQLAQTLSQQNTELQIKAQLASDDAERRSQIAQKRYQAGCQMTVASNDPSKFAAIQQDKPVLDATTAAPLGDGTVVCDSTGQTAIIQNGVAQSLAFSSDRQVIRDAMKRYEGAQYAAPEQ